MYRIPKLPRALALIVSLCAGAACSTGTTEPEPLNGRHSPLMDGIGWVGGGGRTDTVPTTPTITTTGIGVFGGGGRVEQDPQDSTPQ
jgi:hypothetical protein